MPFNGILNQNQTAVPLVFFLRSSTTGQGVTGLTPTVTLSKNGGSFAAPAGAVSEIGSGYYKVAGNATDCGTAGNLRLAATGTGADQADESWMINPSGGISATVDEITDETIDTPNIVDGAITAAKFNQDFFTALANAVVSTGLPIVSNSQQHASRTIVKGNSYSATARQLIISKSTGAEWPTDLSDWTWTFVADKHDDNDNTGDSTATGSVAVVTATGDSQSVRVTIAATATASLAEGQYKHSLRGSLTADSTVKWTIELGILNVLADPANS